MEYVPYGAILAAFALIHLPRQVVSREMKQQPGGYNNHEPRTQQAALEGVGRRALGAHQNAFESFAPFAIAVLAAIQRGGGKTIIAAFAIGFVVVRTIYMLAYLIDKPGLRSGMWGLGMIATTGLFVVAIAAQ
jgi:uncharacterized MAPEG superfamily protein